jgi:hypothetical protein
MSDAFSVGSSTSRASKHLRALQPPLWRAEVLMVFGLAGGAGG